MEAKLIRCTRGALFDVIVDLRKGSPSYGKWAALELSAGNGHMVYIPEGIAHGFQTLVPETEVFYQISTHYAPESAAGISWDDPDLSIDWPPAAERIISPADARHPRFAHAEPLPVALDSGRQD
jgi:dTDP-4-dehydrorhamnose 3,5-epimerase